MGKRYHDAIVALLLITLWGLSGCSAKRNLLANNDQAAPILLKPPLILQADAQAPENKTDDGGWTDDNVDLLEDDLGWNESDQPDTLYTVADPLEKWNRAMFVLNDKLYFWFMKPVARGYRAVIPQPARSGVKNFFFNTAAPIRIVNNMLQGKTQAAEAEWARFLYNATVGVLGFGNPAENKPALNPPVEDLGQTMAKYGFIDGFYLVWPILGPSTLRDTIGGVGDRFLNPIGYVEPIETSLAISAYDQINNLSFRIGDYEAIKKAALDPYEAMRNGYIQLRQSKIRQ